MQGTDGTLAADFVARLFGVSTAGAVYVSSLPNSAEDRDAGEPGEKHVASRDTDVIARFVERWDRPRRGLFFCVSALRSGEARRAKDSVGELALLHADVDFKSIVADEAQVLAAVEQLPSAPSLVIQSGNGLHLYWVLKEAIDLDAEGIARAEGALRQLADLVGGDLAVAEVARLMRLPGTHNTKSDPVQVRVLLGDFDRAHLLEDIEEMLGYMSPVVARKTSFPRLGEKGSATNPYLAAAARLGFRPPVDVQARLEAMSYQGAGDACIHQTQISVTAALLNRGTPVEDAVSTVLEATRAAAGEFGGNWNWMREERAIRRMSEDWLRKNPIREVMTRPDVGIPISEQKQQVAGGDRAALAVVHQLGEARQAKRAKAGGKTPIHIVVGTSVLEALAARDEQVLVTAGQIWRYADGLWSSPTLDGRRWLEMTIETAYRALGLHSETKLVSETRAWILRNPELYVDDVEWDAHGKIPTRSGLVDPKSLAVTPASPEHRATWRIECDFEAGARCPWWERMLSDFFSDRPTELRAETIATIQEMLGLALVELKSKALTKALILQGGSDSGKTSVLEVLSGLLSPSPISMALDAIGGTHGLMEFTRRAPWVLHEAFEQSKWHFSSLVKSILTGDPVQINVKNGPIVTKRVRTPVFWGTNYPPQFKEATRAIVNRIVVIRCRQVFSEADPVGVAVEARRHGVSEPSRFVLEREMPGLLNWAITGLNRALARGHLTLTEEIVTTREEIRADSNLVAGFMAECVEWDEGFMVSTPDFCAAFEVWWTEVKGADRYPPKSEAVGKAVQSLEDDRIVTSRKTAWRCYCGVKLKPGGLDFWNSAHLRGDGPGGRKTGMSNGKDEVNRLLPSDWEARPEIIRMRAAYRKRPPKPPDDHDRSYDSDHDRFGTCHTPTMTGSPVF